MKATECKYCKITRDQLLHCRQNLELARKALKETKIRWQNAEHKIAELQCPDYCAREADARRHAAIEMLEMMEAFRTSYDLIGYEVETVGTIAKRFQDAIIQHFDLEI